jgi:hypothetical protein
MNERGHRIAAMADSLCRGKRYEAADRHVESIATVEQITGEKYAPSAFHSFLDGWDAAMELRHDELQDENVTLHGIILDLCHRLCVERCKACKGQGVDSELDPCPHCDNGWIDKEAPCSES